MRLTPVSQFYVDDTFKSIKHHRDAPSRDNADKSPTTDTGKSGSKPQARTFTTVIYADGQHLVVLLNDLGFTDRPLSLVSHFF